MRSGPPGRRTSLRGDGHACARCSLGDVRRADGAEELAFGARLGRDGEAIIAFNAAARSLAERSSSPACFSSSARRSSKRSTLAARRKRGLALGQEKVAAKAGLDLHAVADVAEVGDLLQQNDFHGGLSVLIGVGQERQEARALDRDGELPLVERLRAGDAARDDLAGLGDVALQGGEILVVDGLDAFGREAAELLAA